MPLKLLALPSLAAALLACATPREVEPGVQALSEIRFEGNSAVDDAELESKILSAESSRWPFGTIRPYDDDSFRNDLLRIERYYRAQGFLSARVADSRVEETETGAAVLVIQIEEGPRARVAAVEMAGLDTGVVHEVKERIVNALPLVEGDPFTEPGYDALKAALQTALRENGYAEATVEGKAVVDPDKAEARILLEVVPGIRYKIGKLIVSGAIAVGKKRIIETADLNEGDWYSIADLNAAQQRVFDMGVFGGVRVSRGAVMRDRGIVPVLITVRESPFQSVKTGVGLGIERESRLEGRVRLEYTHRNLFGGLRRLSAESRLGYAILLNPAKHGVVGLLGVEFTQPNVALLEFDLVARAEAERTLDRSFDDNALRGRLAAPKAFGRRLVLTPSANVEFHQIKGQVPRRAGSLTTECPSPCLVTYGEARATLDLRNDPLDPVRGFLVDLSLQRGFGALSLNSVGYWRIVPEVRAYRRGPFDTVFAGRLKMGAIFPSGSDDEQAPVMARFFAGGASDMRGYGTRQLSPTVEVTCGDGESDCTPGVFPVGGQGLLSANFETRFRFGEALGLTLFVDAGQVTTRFEDLDLSLGGMEYAAGVGFRYRLPIGPIRFDLAWKFDGGAGWDNVKFHLSLGEAF